MSSQEPIDRLDEATAQRLAKLRAMPVDTTALDQRIEQQIPRPMSPDELRPVLLRIRAVRAVAAAIVLLVLGGVILWSLSGGAVMASPDMMARFHDDLVSGRAPATQVSSIDEANRALKDQWDRGVEIPQVPADHVMMCCMRSVQDKRVACVLLNRGGVPVTMAVAKAVDLRVPPQGERVVRNRMEFHVQHAKALNMVMTERGGRWICLIGAVPSDNLIEIASGMQF